MNDETGDDHKDAKKIVLIDKLLEMEQQNLVDRQRVHDHINTFIVAVSGIENMFSHRILEFIIFLGH